ncbi:zinc finger A20 and AN1 domain-containing stress-associated protein 6 [Drosophila eugracilis]|uniref:zinc finger A20 and AN1 domain-containing stress-associated protein 6 n=1 Tax=Drosophila eugracilis TaxID=29029 RepID=UPI0007E719C1|nr:zinc finger A20 and AN1 domain-containing stress-associated protein 6 [Drosophila eugracilis]
MKSGKPRDFDQSKAAASDADLQGRTIEKPQESVQVDDCQQDAQQNQQHDKQKQNQAQEKQNSTAADNNDAGQANKGGSDNAGSTSQDQGQDQDQDAPKKRCAKCGKKLGLTGGYPCRCGGIYCAVHRYSDRHECNFDYREMGASEIRRDNPLVVASKLRKL